jgi:ABC-2 type transport system ATP-binding protein
MAVSPIIEIKALTRRFGQRLAVDDLSLAVQAGDIFGFLGPNGAGKTTTLRILATLMQPTSGDAWIAGHSVTQAPRQARRLIGYMPDTFGVYNDLRAGEYLDFFARCYNIPAAQRQGLIADLLALVDLSHRSDDSVESLSRGMMQRLSLARTLVHDPQVLLLDEPASGLDPRARIEIRELLVELARMGKTIFFSTHILSDVAEICTRVGILEAGKLVALGRPEELQRQVLALRQVQVTLLGPAEQAMEALNGLPGVVEVMEKDGLNADGHTLLEFSFAGDDRALAGLLSALIARNIEVLHFSENKRDLEEIFLRTTRGVVT